VQNLKTLANHIWRPALNMPGDAVQALSACRKRHPETKEPGMELPGSQG
jgi:hypothetical protein